MYINIAILSKTVNLHGKYLKQSLNRKKLYTFISHSWKFSLRFWWKLQCFDKFCFLLAVGDMVEQKHFQYSWFGIFGRQYYPPPPPPPSADIEIFLHSISTKPNNLPTTKKIAQRILVLTWYNHLDNHRSLYCTWIAPKTSNPWAASWPNRCLVLSPRDRSGSGWRLLNRRS